MPDGPGEDSAIVLTAGAGATRDVLCHAGPDSSRAILDAGQRSRWQSLRRSQDRDDFLAARVLARHLIGSVAGLGGLYVGPIRQTCPRCDAPHGRPTVVELPHLNVSWAHARGHVAAAVSTSPVGVDIEPVTAMPPPLHGTDDAPGGGLPDPRWLAWTRSEALVKLGAGELDVTARWPLSWPPDDRGRAVRLPTHDRRHVTLTDLLADDHSWVASVAGAAAAHLVAVPPAFPEITGSRWDPARS